MRGNTFLDKMELIDPAYVEAADAAPKAKKKIWTGWRAAMAACICLALLAGTAAAVSGRGATWLIGMFDREMDSDYMESGYELGAEIRKFPVSEMSEEAQAIGEQIKHQFAVYSPYSSMYPGSWWKDFPSAEEAWEFVGLDSLNKLNWDIEEDAYNRVFALGSPSGKVKTITIVTIYKVDDIILQAETEIYTEYSDDDEGRMKVVIPEEVEMTETVYTTASGKQCQIIASSALESGRLSMNGHLADNGILYTLFVNYAEPDAAQAEELLHQWADMF